MANILQYIHDKHIIHRDIKPDNFVMGAKEHNDKLYLLDFGLAKKYRSSRTLIQYPYVKRKKLTGTARYASHALEAYEQSRRDNLECVGYVLMNFLKGKLPWQGLRVKSKEDKYKKILEKKRETSSEELCKNFPFEFYNYVEFTKNLDYEENPDYNMLKNKFLEVLKKRQDKFDYIYDWTTTSDMNLRKDKRKIKEDPDDESYKEKKNTQKEVNFNNNNMIQGINSKQFKRELTQEKDDKDESVCCIV